MGKYDQAVVRAFEYEMGGDPLKCVGFGSRLSFIGVESEKPAQGPRYLRDHVLERVRS
jgi:hypothetical protein